MVTLQEELLQARAAVIEAARDIEAIRNNPAFRRLMPHFFLLSQVNPPLRSVLLTFLRGPLLPEIGARLKASTASGVSASKPGWLLQAVCKNLATEPAFLNCEETDLMAALTCPVDRKGGKTLQQFIRRLDDETKLVARRSELEARVAMLPEQPAVPRISEPVTPPISPVREFLKIPEALLPARQRTCAHWEFEGGPRCPNPVAVFPGGKEYPYCETHLGKCQNPQCPNGPDYRIPRRYQYCARCKDFPRTPSWRR